MPAASRTLRILSKAKGSYFFHVIPLKILIAVYMMLVKLDYKKIDITLKLFVQLVYFFIFLFFLIITSLFSFSSSEPNTVTENYQNRKKNVNKKGVKM